jgi:CspA family cold shock protein
MVDGVVKWFDAKKGYGFIVSPDVEELNGKDVFVHFTKLQMEGFRKLEAAEAVTYDLTWSPEGKPQADNVVRRAVPETPES